MPSYSQGASAFFERYNPYAFAVLCSGLALFVAISRLARWRAHGDSFEVDDEAAKRCNVLNVALLPAYELVLIGKLLCVVSVPFVGAAVMALVGERPLRCDVYVPLVILWRFVLEVNGFSNMVVLYFLVAPSGGTKTMKISLALAFISAVLITLCATFEDYSPSITNPCYTDWGTSFLSTALPTWLQPGDGTNTLFMSAWCVIFFSGLVMLLLLVMVAKTAVPQLCPWNPRQGWLALSALGLLLCQNVILSHANYKGDELGSYFGFDITFLILAIEEPIWYYIFWRDSRYWMHFTFDGDTTPAALDRLASDPLKSAMATEMFTRGQGRRAPHIPYNHITFEKILASGAAGTVWRCAVSGLRGDRAVKRMQCAEINKKTVSSLCKEVELSWLLCSGCRHIVRMDGFTVSPPDICVVMQLCDCGSLLEVLGGRVVRVDRLRLAAETAAAVAHLHMLDIVHRDLKSLNVMCSVSQGVTTSYLGDFGESLTVEEAAEEVPRQVGTVPWMAPEIIENWKVMARTRLEDGNPFMGTHYSKASDCFSLAVIAWECEVQRAPYAHFPLHPTRKRPLLDADRLMLGDFIVDKGLRPNTEEADVIPAEVLAVLESGWHADPIQRMAASQMKSALDRECNAIECNCQRSTDNAANTEPLGGEPEVLIEMAEGSTALEDRVPSC